MRVCVCVCVLRGPARYSSHSGRPERAEKAAAAVSVPLPPRLTGWQWQLLRGCVPALFVRPQEWEKSQAVAGRALQIVKHAWRIASENSLGC